LTGSRSKFTARLQSKADLHRPRANHRPLRTHSVTNWRTESGPARTAAIGRERQARARSRDLLPYEKFWRHRNNRHISLGDSPSEAPHRSNHRHQSRRHDGCILRTRHRAGDSPDQTGTKKNPRDSWIEGHQGRVGKPLSLAAHRAKRRKPSDTFWIPLASPLRAAPDKSTRRNSSRRLPLFLRVAIVLFSNRTPCSLGLGFSRCGLDVTVLEYAALTLGCSLEDDIHHGPG